MIDLIEKFKNVHKTEHEKATDTPSNSCARCGVTGERYCLGKDKHDKYIWGFFCLKCEPFDFPLIEENEIELSD